MTRFGLDARDGLGVSAVCCVVYGVAQWSRPAAWVVLGVVLAAVWLTPHLRKGV